MLTLMRLKFAEKVRNISTLILVKIVNGPRVHVVLARNVCTCWILQAVSSASLLVSSLKGTNTATRQMKVQYVSSYRAAYKEKDRQAEKQTDRQIDVMTNVN
ncbi:hypothetical protein DPMN_129431 [Dreissena polymorpha]|uniref:Uncharacterized protein n=1 Tax=Dreissena polymorpha TaxID=45954 RepID=A0A9D4JXC4_DREPO|nr:hypothetical protein DPMN_129431 [Dreissena polymorpha]